MFTLFNSTKSKTFRTVHGKIKTFRTIPRHNIRLLRRGFSLNLILMTVNLEYRIYKIHFLLLKVYTLLIKKSIIIVSKFFSIVLISVFQTSQCIYILVSSISICVNIFHLGDLCGHFLVLISKNVKQSHIGIISINIIVQPILWLSR